MSSQRFQKRFYAFCLLLIVSTVGWLASPPVNAQPDKRVAIVYSDPSANHFYDRFAYNQLYMAMQHQVMMAGIPYDLLNEDDLTDISKLATYDALIIPSMQYVTASKADAITTTLQQAVFNYGIGLLTSGNFITNTETGALIASDPYVTMRDLLGLQYLNSNSSVAMDLYADSSHPAMGSYASNELIRHYNQIWSDSFGPINGQSSTLLATFNVNGQSYNGVQSTLTGGRNVHFANDQILGDTNIAWSAIQWMVYNSETPVALKMGRNQSLFISRNDMDQSMFADEVAITEVPLYDLLTNWKSLYNFVGSYYINIGDRPSQGEYTDWGISAPLYSNYIALGNEIGTHSWSHPDETSLLTAAQLEYQFNQSALEIGSRLGVPVLGTAIPGMPESLAVDEQIQAYFNYISGRSSVVGSGYPSAFGRMEPAAIANYFSLNMSPDFTLIDWLGYSNTQAEQIWADEYIDLIDHASQPIIHWMWHDYGPTVEANKKYSVAMYANTIQMAYNNGAEFLTLAELDQRIRNFQGSALTTDGSNPLNVAVNASGVGAFSLQVPASQTIQQVTNWYAYDEDQVFIDEDGGDFQIVLGTPADLTHITALPMRAKLISLNGNGTELGFTIEGEGDVTLHLNSALAANLAIDGGDSSSQRSQTLTISFNSYGTHTAALTLSGGNQLPLADAQAVVMDQDQLLAITLSGSDPEGASLSYSVISNPTNGSLSGSAPELTYTPNSGFIGSDSFTFTVSDGQLTSAPATISITVNKVNHAPLADAQAVAINQDQALAIILSGSDSDGDALNYSVLTAPTNGSLSGTAPNLTYTPASGFVGSDSFTFVASDGQLSSAPAEVSITVSLVNQPPVAASQAVITQQEQSLTITLSGSDPEGSSLSYSVTSNPANGTLSGAAPNLIYTPNSGFIGSDSFSFSVSDGLLSSSPATVSISVNIAAIEPTSNPVGSITLDGDLSDWSGLTAFSSDPDDVTASNELIDWLQAWAAHSSSDLYLAYQNDGSISPSWGQNLYLDTDANSATGFSASGSFPIGAEYLLQSVYLYQYSGDGSSWSWSYVTTVNSAISGNSAELSVPLAQLGNPTEIHLFFLGENSAYGGTTVDYYPDAAASGTTYLSYSLAGSSSNQAPVADAQAVTTDQGQAVAITLTGSDPEGTSIGYSVSAPTNGMLSGTAPNLIYTPAAGFSGSDSFSFTVNDGQLTSAPATVSISVNAVIIEVISNPVTSLTLDGDLSDWVALTPFSSDPNDISGSNDLIDWLQAWFAHSASDLYIAYQNDGPITPSWGQNLYLDTDANPATGFSAGGSFPIGAEYLLQNSSLYQYTGDGSSWSWSYVTAANSAINGNNAELSVALTQIGNPTTIQLFFLGENSAYGGSTTDYYPDGAADSNSTTRSLSYTIQ